MAEQTTFWNSWTAGEIGPEAWDRTDIQPVSKGCQLALNLQPSVQGPLKKRRGFWFNGVIANQALPARLIPFRRSIDDALVLEFGDSIVRVWATDGSPLLNAGVQVSFASPYTQAQVSSLRYKQVGDVIYFTSSLGLQPQSLSRTSNTTWSFAPITYPNGPWLPVVSPTPGMNVTQTAGPSETFYIAAGATVALACVAAFNPSQIGGFFRIQNPNGAVGVNNWAPATNYTALGFPVVSNGRMYVTATTGKSGTNPPVHTEGTISDGGIEWTYVSDGAGIVQITAVTDANNAVGTVTAGIPFQSDVLTNDWAEGAYSNYRGWPTSWPGMREERLAFGATSYNTDMLDLTQTAGFQPTTADFTPGLGTGAVVDTNAIRVRLGDDGAKIIWGITTTYLLCASDSGLYLVAGSVLDEPLSPSAVTVKPLSTFGAADAMPVKAWDGVLYITQTGQTLREIVVDTQQNRVSQDMSFLATHLTSRGFAQLAWTSDPDFNLWIRLADGGLCAFTYHQEQQVKGFSTQQLGGLIGWTVEDAIVVPGEAKLDTLWIIAARVKGGVQQRHILMLSAPADALFMDAAVLYEGAAETVMSNLPPQLEGETVRVLADGAQYDGLIVTGGQITLPVAAAKVMIGLSYQTEFISGRADIAGPGGSIGTKQKLIQASVSLTTALANVGIYGKSLEQVSSRLPINNPGTGARRLTQQCTLNGDTDLDPRITVTDDSAYAHSINSIRLKGAANG